MQPPFESWSLSRLPAPTRSRLYSLEPIGVGTATVEGLTGYVARLAEARSVSVGDLVGRVLSELTDPKDPIAANLGYSNDGYVHQKYPELCGQSATRSSWRKKLNSPP